MVCNIVITVIYITVIYITVTLLLRSGSEKIGYFLVNKHFKKKNKT